MVLTSFQKSPAREGYCKILPPVRSHRDTAMGRLPSGSRTVRSMPDAITIPVEAVCSGDRNSGSGMNQGLPGRIMYRTSHHREVLFVPSRSAVREPDGSFPSSTGNQLLSAVLTCSADREASEQGKNTGGNGGVYATLKKTKSK